MTRCLILLALALAPLAASCSRSTERVLTFSGSVVGREGEVIARQIARFQRQYPELRVEIRATPDAADVRHQLYVQWLNARVSEPDVLQLDVIWTAEFAAAGWIAKLDRFSPPVSDLFAAAVTADRWNGSLFALPWFIDVGMLYRRADLVPEAPADLAALSAQAGIAMETGNVPLGFVWQGARYEGLITVFLEHLGAFGGHILDGSGRVAVDSDAAVQALTFMRDAIYADGIVPAAVLGWQEEQTRFAFQNGQAVFMRNWPYAFPLTQDPAQSSVAGRVAVSPMPGTAAGAPTAALGGASLAINAHSDQIDDAYRLMLFLMEPEQMIERARVAGQYPTRPDLYRSGALDKVLTIAPADVLAIIERATPRPVTPVYSQLSEILQVSLHRALTRQREPRDALREAADAMRVLLDSVKLAPSPS